MGYTFMANLRKTLEDVIAKSFPELKTEEIQVKYERMDSLMAYTPENEGFTISVDFTLKKAPKGVLEGGFAHECGHLIDELRLPKNTLKCDGNLYKKFKRYKILDERNTDLEVILRGYGKQLLAFKEYAEHLGYPYFKEDGLSIREVKKLIYQK
jgi:hypothetical protein